MLRDLGSTNGSFVQGSRFNELTLGFGTEVTIGKTVLKYLPTEEEVDLGAVRPGELRLAGRARCEAAPAVPRAGRRGGDRRHRADRRRDRHRQGAARRGDPPPQPAPGRPVHRVRLRRRPRRADRVGAVRARAGRVHGRDHGSPGRVRGGRRRHAVPRRDRRAGARRAAGAAARAGQAVGAARRRHRPTRAPRCASSRRPTATCAPRSPRRRFREDLYYRVAVVRMSCRRCASAPTTSRCWCSTSCASSAATARCEVAPEDLERLRRHDWLGNVRELRNVIERACARQPRRSPGAGRRARRAADAGAACRAGRRRRPAVQGSEGAHRRGVRARATSRRCSSATRETCRRRARGAEIDRKHLRELLRKHGLRESGDS